MNFSEQYMPSMKFEEKENITIDPSYWFIKKDGYLDVIIQGNAEAIDTDYIELADKVFNDWDKYIDSATISLSIILKGEMALGCSCIIFQEYCYGHNFTKKRTGGFEMFFCQTTPDDDRYVQYVVQFNKQGRIVGHRIFSY